MSIKQQFIVLFIISIFNLIYSYLGNSFPDNTLSVSSNSDDINSLSYYFFSLISYISYYSGIWLVFAFTFMLFLLSLTSSKIDKKSYLLIPMLVSTLFLGICYLLVPDFIGDGLLVLLNKFINPYLIFILLFFSFSFTAYLTIDNTVFVKFKEFPKFLKLYCTKILSFFNFNKFLFLKKKKKILTNLKNEFLEAKVDKILKKPIKESNLNIIIDENNVAVDASLNKHSKSVKSSDSVINKNDNLEVKINFSKINNEFFNTDTLIDCISGHGQDNSTSNPDDDYFVYIHENIEEKLSEFKVEAKIVNVLKGPVVDTFELELGPAVKVSKVMGLSDDIGLALNGAPIRIVYPMKGRSTIGIEVPRNPRDIIFLDEVLRSEQFNSSRYRLPVAMGRDAFGEVSVVDLASMPHMLVAGATGAGKSVFINTLLVSLIIKMSPRQMKLLLIDPKQLELALYQDLPHLMLPVVTEAKSASIALLWAVQEMERRYSILKEIGVKNIEGFNKKIKNCPAQMLARLNDYYTEQDSSGYELPYLVIIIDEFADLILTKSGKEIEDNVNRLAAKARAAGIHIVLATQRPSTDVVTGVIKANFPTRVAFRVTTATDSRVILDQLGAEKLLGKGDMLYKHGVDVMRVHSSYVEEEEIEQLVAKLSTIPAEFNNDAMRFLEEVDTLGESEVTVSFGAPKPTGDQLYDEAVEVVIEQGSASASMLQRRLRVGYNRAANLIEEMEKNGIVGPQQGSKPRDILISRFE